MGTVERSYIMANMSSSGGPTMVPLPTHDDTFAHMCLGPGKHEVFVRLQSNSGGAQVTPCLAYFKRYLAKFTPRFPMHHGRFTWRCY